MSPVQNQVTIKWEWLTSLRLKDFKLVHGPKALFPESLGKAVHRGVCLDKNEACGSLLRPAPSPSCQVHQGHSHSLITGHPPFGTRQSVTLVTLSYNPAKENQRRTGDTIGPESLKDNIPQPTWVTGREYNKRTIDTSMGKVYGKPWIWDLGSGSEAAPCLLLDVKGEGKGRAEAPRGRGLHNRGCDLQLRDTVNSWRPVGGEQGVEG